MRILLQRVNGASVMVNESEIARIGRGVLAFVGIKAGDGKKEIEQMVEKVLNLRLFEDDESKFDRSLIDLKCEILLVPQFTLYGDCSKGRRPDFTAAAPVEDAKIIYNDLVDAFRRTGHKVDGGIFQAHMQVNLVNDGPVTLIVDSK